jgi:hypothetical protein
MQTKSQYCKTKSQIKREDYSGMTQHGLIFTGTTPIGNIPPFKLNDRSLSPKCVQRYQYINNLYFSLLGAFVWEAFVLDPVYI